MSLSHPVPHLLVFILICVCAPSQSSQVDPVSLIRQFAQGLDADRNLNIFNIGNADFRLSDFPQFWNNTFSSLLANFLRNETYSKCAEDVFYTLQSIKTFDEWALRMVDSFGKPESGILELNLKWLGDYDECLSVYAPPKPNKNSVGDFNGRYCSLSLSVPIGEKKLPISLGVCLPDSCDPSSFDTPQNFTSPLKNIDAKIDSILNNTVLTCPPVTRPISSGAIVVISLISFFALLAVIGTSITAYEKIFEINTKPKTKCVGVVSEKNEAINHDLEKQSRAGSDEVLLLESQPRSLPVWMEKCKLVCNCFCFITNGEKLLNTDNAEGQLPSLHGIRFLSMTWVMLCHAYVFCMNSIESQARTKPVLEKWTFQIILNGFYSVDSFFLLSGFLLAYLFFQESSKKDGKIPWVYFYVHRYVRLTPVYMMVLAFNATVVYYLGNGPLWPALQYDPNCSTSWWYNMLYINNFQDSKYQCMAWSWYLANDMQFFVISPLFLITIWRWPKVGFSIVGLFLTLSFIANFVITYHYDLPTGFGNMVGHMDEASEFLRRWGVFFDKVYTKPYARISPYLIGIVLAYFLVKCKQTNYPKLHWVKLLLGWIVAAGITLACLFGPYRQDLTVVAAGFYNGLNRTGFALGLGWVIFVCLTEQGGPVNTFLSWKFFIPLSRLTFCAYLVHPIIEMGYYQSVKTLLDFNNLTIVTLYLGFLVLSYGSAMLTSLLFESPLIRLEKVVRSVFMPKKTE